jgi:hypothetical protein
MFIMLCLMCMVLATMSHPNNTTIFPLPLLNSNGTSIEAGAWIGVSGLSGTCGSVFATWDMGSPGRLKVLDRLLYGSRAMIALDLSVGWRALSISIDNLSVNYSAVLLANSTNNSLLIGEWASGELVLCSASAVVVFSDVRECGCVHSQHILIITDDSSFIEGLARVELVFGNTSSVVNFWDGCVMGCSDVCTHTNFLNYYLQYFVELLVPLDRASFSLSGGMCYVTRYPTNFSLQTVYYRICGWEMMWGDISSPKGRNTFWHKCVRSHASACEGGCFDLDLYLSCRAFQALQDGIKGCSRRTTDGDEIEHLCSKTEFSREKPSFSSRDDDSSDRRGHHPVSLIPFCSS